MGLFKRSKPEIRADTGTINYDDALLQALLGSTSITKSVALQVPTIASCIDLISSIVAGTPIKLYKLSGDKVTEVTDDPRIQLLNDDTGDTLNAHDFWRAVIADYYLGKGGYAYINKQRGKVASLHYVDEIYVTPQVNTDHIFKDYDLLVDAKTYKPYDFLKILRNSKDGASGTGIVTENSKAIEVAYESLIFENNLVKKGGNKKGFLKSGKRLTTDAMASLKASFKKLYSSSSENVVVLNDGIDFIESSNTSVEMQLNENKVTNSMELCKVFHISPDVIAGKATESDMQSVAKLAAIPLMKTIECAANRDLLLEKEKKVFYWAFDTKELLKGSLSERMAAYGTAVDKGIMMRNEVRYAEDLPSIDGMDVISMSLADVIYDTKTGTYFTPNTKQITNASGETEQTDGADTGGIETLTTSEAKNTAEEVTGKTLNGAQTQSLITVVQQYQAGGLTLAQAVNIIAVAIGITREAAQELIGEAATT
ncbi:MAG: phage portal protein [Prevotella sp.]